jgi:hypothetical protein
MNKTYNKMSKVEREAEDKAMREYISPLQEMLASRRKEARQNGEGPTTLLSTKGIRILRG